VTQNLGGGLRITTGNNTKTGDVVYELQAWDSVRSDSHQLAYRVTGADLSAGNVVAFRRPLIQCQQVDSWEQLLAVVAKEQEAA
jgi:hypothetical protein